MENRSLPPASTSMSAFPNRPEALARSPRHPAQTTPPLGLPCCPQGKAARAAAGPGPGTRGGGSTYVPVPLNRQRLSRALPAGAAGPQPAQQRHGQPRRGKGAGAQRRRGGGWSLPPLPWGRRHYPLAGLAGARLMPCSSRRPLQAGGYRRCLQLPSRYRFAVGKQSLPCPPRWAVPQGGRGTLSSFVPEVGQCLGSSSPAWTGFFIQGKST